MISTCQRTLRAVSIVSLCLPSAALQAQRPQSFDAVDSAQAARAHYASARTALRSGNSREAQRMLEFAARAWPTQAAYTASLAVISARNADASALVSALSRLVTLEMGTDVLADSAVMALASRDSLVASASARLRAAVQPLTASRMHRELRDSTIFPEGVAIDPKSGAMYITSIRHGTIVEVTSNGVEREIIPAPRSGIGAMLAVRVDGDGKHLWATTAGMPLHQDFTAGDSSIAALVRLRIADGVVVGRWDLGTDSKHVPGDLAIAPNGDVYVSDSQSPILFRLRKGHVKFETITHPSFRSLQGIAIRPDGTRLYVADYSHGLLSMNLDGGDIRLLRHDDSISTLGLDGIVLHGSSIVAVQNGSYPARVVRYELDAGGTAIKSARTLDRQPDVADEPTNGALYGDDFVYIANSQFSKYDDNGKRIAGRPLLAPRLLRLPLGAMPRPW